MDVKQLQLKQTEELKKKKKKPETQFKSIFIDFWDTKFKVQ